MSEFFQICFSFPTVAYTTMLGVVCLYWIVVIASGGAGMDALDFQLGSVEGGADAAGGALSHVFAAMGFDIVPFPITLSIIVISGWASSFFGTLYLSSWIGAGLLNAIIMLVVSLGVAFVAGTVLIQPLRPLFRTYDESGGDSMVGEVCTIRSSSVDGEHGRARFQDEVRDSILSVRCPEDNSLERGSKALIIGYDEDENTYHVEPYEDVIGG